MERMSKQQEKQLVGHVQTVIDSVSGGANPTDALFKVASDNQLAPQFIQRVGEAYNQSRALYELREKQGSARLQTFLVANPDAVIEKMYPKSYTSKVAAMQKSAAAQRCNLPNTTDFIGMTKDASKNLIRTETKFEKVAYAPTLSTNDKAMIKNAHVDANVKLSQVIRDFPTEFRQKIGNTPFHRIEMGMHQKYGSVVAPLIKLAFELSGMQKFGHRRATAAELDITNQTLMDFANPGFASMENLIGSAMNLHKRAEEAKTIAIDCQECDSNGQNQLKKPKNKSERNDIVIEEKTEKKAFGEPFTNMWKGTKGYFGGIDSDMKTKYKNELDKSIVALEDPKFRNDSKQIQVQSMLHDLMTNDEVISSYQPDEVADAFNQIYQIAPEAATSNAVMRDMMRRYLVQGGLESMELGQAAQLNKNLVEARNDNSRYDRIQAMQADPRLRTTDKIPDNKKAQTPGAQINF